MCNRNMQKFGDERIKYRKYNKNLWNVGNILGMKYIDDYFCVYKRNVKKGEENGKIYN